VIEDKSRMQFTIDELQTTVDELQVGVTGAIGGIGAVDDSPLHYHSVNFEDAAAVGDTADPVDKVDTSQTHGEGPTAGNANKPMHPPNRLQKILTGYRNPSH